MIWLWWGFDMKWMILVVVCMLMLVVIGVEVGCSFSGFSGGSGWFSVIGGGFLCFSGLFGYLFFGGYCGLVVIGLWLFNSVCCIEGMVCGGYWVIEDGVKEWVMVG